LEKTAKEGRLFFGEAGLFRGFKRARELLDLLAGGFGV
jgi:hypothetical protein